jgi:ATP-dependent exoDNAse (exonuclease V) beta subunit
MNNIKPLEVLSASAGSGKTYALVQNYLKINLEETHGQFERVIAMTFTNKAALEMKERIISALDQLGFPNRSSPKATEKAAELMQETVKRTGRSSAELTDFARNMLSKILHNYGDFKIQTIDKFSLQLIRTFSRDLNINEDFEVILKEKELLERVVDQLLSNIGKKGYEKVTRYALHYAKTNLEDGKNWNFRNSLIEFSQTLIKEVNKDYVQQIVQHDYSDATLEAYRSEMQQMKTIITEHQTQILSILARHGITADDLPYKTSGIFSFYQKMEQQSGMYSEPGPRVLRTLDGSLVKAEHIFPDELRDATNRYIEICGPYAERLFLLDRIIRNFFNLALLKYIAIELEELKEQDNVIMISDFNKMIASLLQEEQADYVYERLGNRYNHYLLDEFQDTSRLQWLNLVPLIHNSIAQGHRNLIVGDPKQAIYRFRNGVVEQFVELPKIYNPEGDPKIALTSAHFDTMGIKDTIKENWRSLVNIVQFNNHFFETSRTYLGADQSYYDKVSQIPKSKAGGYIRFERFDKPAEGDEAEFLLRTVRACLSDNYDPGDLCLLGRNKKDGNRWAKILSKAPEKFKVVSEDSLSIQADKTVQLFIHYCSIRKNTANPTPQIRFASDYFTLEGENPIGALAAYWKDGQIGKFDFTQFITSSFDSPAAFWFNYENLYDLGQKFLRLIQRTELTNPYFHHLMEMLHNYDVQFGPDLRGFLDYWQEDGKTQTVQIPENKDAIRIMTAHKAKGLEFPVVILPNLSWNLSIKDSFFIRTTSNELLYTTVSKNAASEIIRNRQQEEYAKVVLDEYNLLYVAFTRAEKRLYGRIQASDKKPTTEPNRIDQIIDSTLPQLTEQLSGCRLTETEFTYGKAQELTKKEGDVDTSLFKAKDVTDTLWFPEITLNEQRTDEFVSEEMAFGRQLHKILERANSPSELDTVIQQLQAEDQLEKSIISSLRDKAMEVLTLPGMTSLMNSAEKILSEQSIIIDSDHQLRPDKLFIRGKTCTILDYKTGKKEAKHKKQIDMYIKYLSAMDFSEVKGVLLYTDTLEMEEV